MQPRERGERRLHRHTPDQAAAVHSRGASLALGLAAATLAFWSGALILVWLAFASSALTDGAGVVLGLSVALIVGMVGFFVVLVAHRRPRVLARVEQVAAAGMVAAIVCVALDRGDLHSDGDRVSVAFVYPLWTLVAMLFVWGAAIARKAARN